MNDALDVFNAIAVPVLCVWVYYLSRMVFALGRDIERLQEHNEGIMDSETPEREWMLET